MADPLSGQVIKVIIQSMQAAFPVEALAGEQAIDETTTRARLVEAAAEVFAEQGFDRARVQEIARRAGLTTGAIYANFSGKAELLVEAIDRASTPELDRLMGDSVLTGSAPDILVAIGESISKLQSGLGSQLLFEAFVAARRDRDIAETLREEVESRISHFETLIALGQDEGTIVEDIDTEAVAKFSISIALGFLVLDLLSIGLPDKDGWSDVLNRIVGSISTTGPGSEGKQQIN